jgi:hypothetical protein
MKWVVLVVRTLVGLGYTVTGLNGFLNLMKMPDPPTPEAGQYLGLLVGSGYMYGVKVCELLGGLALLSGKLVPIGLTLLMPVAVNILLYEITLMKQPGPGCVIVPLLIFLIWAYRRYFLPVFTVDATIGA